MLDPVQLTEQLVAIPSVRAGTAEGPIAEWIEGQLPLLLPDMPVRREPVAEGRWNIVIGDLARARVLFIGHLDTVIVGNGWTRSPAGEHMGDYLYGRGALDMKAGIAAVLSALASVDRRSREDTAVLLYCDEEYEFAGMRAFLRAHAHPGRVALVVAPEPTHLRIRNGCRGVAELHCTVAGRRGHAARPTTGVSVYDAFVAGMDTLDRMLAGRTEDAFGRATRNVAMLRCGHLVTTQPDGDAAFGNSANIIPDFAEAIIEVRTVPGVTGSACADAFASGVTQRGASVGSMELPLDLEPFVTPERALTRVIAACASLGEARFDDLSTTGYSDVALLAAQWRVPCVMLGASGSNAHAPDEYVDVRSIATLTAMCVGVMTGEAV